MRPVRLAVKQVSFIGFGAYPTACAVDLSPKNGRFPFPVEKANKRFGSRKID